jgi:AcrR family transcriptional regulator
MKTMLTTIAPRPPARVRLLDAAEDLFYEEGVHSVGIDRVIERAGVAKATLYSTFGSKDELVRSYLERRNLIWRDLLTRELQARYDTPRERLLGVFDVLGESFAEPAFRGCAFVNASAEACPGGVVEAVADEARAWRRALLLRLAQHSGVADPESLARQLSLLYDGAMVAAGMDRDPGTARTARAIAVTLLDAAKVA